MYILKKTLIMSYNSISVRIKRDLSRIIKYKDLFKIDIDDNILFWNVLIKGPEDSYYRGKEYNIEVNFININYPFDPPKITFKDKIFHPNIDDKGNICLDLLKESWQPTIPMINILKSILSLLKYPNVDDPLNIDAANIYKKNQEEFKKIIEKKY